MRRFLVTICTWLALAPSSQAERQRENLARGLVAVRTESDGTFVSWRLLATDPLGVAFNLYRVVGAGEPVRANDEPISGATNFLDNAERAAAEEKLRYFVRPIGAGAETPASEPAPVWQDNYLDIPIQPIDDYRPGDASVGDLDGDGEYEIVLHQTSRGRDNSFAGVTGEPVLDAYRLDGTHLWRINLGKNIREGEHYTQFMVYDLDGDGRAEVACKTADGTTDGQGKVIGDASKDWRTHDPGDRRDGRILDGPEYLTVFDGQTGAALKTVDYIPGRDPINGWGGIGGNAGNDSFGNRCDRFLACIAYLDGERPSLVMCRGVYGRIVIAAWDWRDGALSSRWVFDTGSSYPPFDDASPYSGMGGHSLSVADVDDDGRDEIVYQAMVVDDDGKGLYSTGLRHGDSMHVTDMYPDRPGLEVFTVQENEENAEKFQTPGAAMRDARTGQILWSHSPTADVPHGMAADIDPTHRGYEAWSGPDGLDELLDSKGKPIGPAPRETGWCIWWDGDPLRELFSAGWRRRGARILKWNWKEGVEETIFEADARTAGRWPCLAADLLGDWREELVLVAPDGKSLRLYTTTIPTDIRLPTLMHDPQYRLGIAWQNVTYNKPAHPSFYLGDGMQLPSKK
jgi:rhamnogalacturonan endolyase